MIDHFLVPKSLIDEGVISHAKFCPQGLQDGPPPASFTFPVGLEVGLGHGTSKTALILQQMQHTNWAGLPSIHIDQTSLE
jgi:hypothetical protein